MNLNLFLENTLKNGGCSTSFINGVTDPKHGFFASFKGSEMIIKLEDLTSTKLSNLMLPFLRKNEKELRVTGNFVGSWIDSNLVYIDVSKQFYNEKTCKEFAIKNEQQAYFNAETQNVIELN